MDKILNEIIRRKNYQNFLLNGEVIMDYRISNECSNKAKQFIENDEINERLKVLKNQISFLNDVCENNTTFTNEELVDINRNVDILNNGIDVLNFQKQTLQSGIEQNYNDMNIKCAVDLKNKLLGIEEQLGGLRKEKGKLEEKIKSSRLDFDVQLIKLREKYNDAEINISQFEDADFSNSVVIEYKKERASKLVNDFMITLTPEKQKEILDNNQDLKGLVNVGENI